MLVDLVDHILSSPKLTSIYWISFEQSIHTFRRSVVRASPDSSHTDLQTVLLQTLTVGISRVLSAMIGMQDRTIAQGVLGQCQFHVLDDSLDRWLSISLSLREHTIVQIFDYTQIQRTFSSR